MMYFTCFAVGTWVEFGKPCGAHTHTHTHTHVSVCSSVVMDSWTANCNITAVTACPETKPNVHKKICSLGMSFTFTKVAELIRVTSIQSGFMILMFLSF
jgi:hypothetical protein